MVKKYNKKLIVFLVLIVFIISLVTALYFLTPEEIVNTLGIRNAYLLAFVVAFFGGFSAGGSFAFISTIATLSIGGLNPIILGLVAGISLAIGDGIMFYLGSKGRELVIGKWKKRLDKVSHWTKRKAGKAIPFIAYLYIGLTPFPNDLIIIFLAIIKYPIKKLYAPIVLGDITFALLVSILAAKSLLIFN